MKQQVPSCNDPFETNAITVSEAVSHILNNTESIRQYEKLAIRECLNRVLHEPLISPVNVPAHDNSAMDGIAVNSRYLPESGSKVLKIVGTAFAGQPFDRPIGEDECIRVMTGALIPADVDSVIMQEKITLKSDTRVQVDSDNRKHQNVRFAGEDIKAGQAVLDKGHVIGAADLGVIASLGIAECRVTRKPRVAFFSTGDELKSIGETLQAGDIYDSNRYALYGLLSRCDVNMIDMGVVRDKPDELREALLTASNNADLIITSGGVSVGEADFIKTILEEIGTMDFWKIAMKPGRPLTFGKINDCHFFGLPGNPVAVMVTFYNFVLPCLKKLAGKTVSSPISFKATSQSEIRKRSNRREFQRGIAFTGEDGNLQAKLTGKQGSGILTSMSQANCFIVLPEDSGSVSIGDTVLVEFLEDYF
jgi:molybdopterin molybdotransferase